MKSKKILVTGGNGQLGSELKILAQRDQSYSFTFIDLEDLDLTRRADVEEYFARNQFNYIINCAAYTAVDKAEEEETLAYSVNEFVAGLLAEQAEQQEAVIIHVSTDFVFGGNTSKPLTENDQTEPLSIYGKSKLAGEQKVVSNCSRHFILRTSWLYSSFGNNFVKTIIRLAETRDKLGIVYDQVGTPTYAADLAEAIIKIVTKDSYHYGIYHYSNEGVASWYDFTLAIKELFNLETEINPILAIEYPLPATRPAFSVMHKGKIKETLGITIPYWKTSLLKCKQAMNQEQKKPSN